MWQSCALFKNVRSPCLLSFMLCDEWGLLALCGPVMFLSGLSWLRWMLRVTALSALAFHLVFLSQPRRAAWGPGAGGFIVTMLSGAECAVGSDLKCSLAWVLTSVICRETLVSDMRVLGKFGKSCCSLSCLQRWITWGKLKGMDPWHTQHMQIVQRCWVSVWDCLNSRAVCIDVVGFCCTSSGALVFCWHFWAQFRCLSWFFYQLSQGFSSSREMHPNKTSKTWGAGEYKSCSWLSSKSQMWVVMCKFLRRNNMFL